MRPLSSDIGMDDRQHNYAPAPNRRPRFPLGGLGAFEYLVCAPPPSPAAIGEARRWGVLFPVRPFQKIVMVGTVALLCCGCFPLRRLSTPGVSGVVVNSRTGSLVTNAQVVVSPIHHSEPSVDEVLANAEARTATTGSNGEFAFAPERRWGLYVVGTDLWPPSGALVVSGGGYEPVVVGFWTKGQTQTNLGFILLKEVVK